MARVDQIREVRGTLEVRFVKDDGGYHRTTIPDDVDVDVQLDVVEAHLAAMGDRTKVRVLDRVSLKALRPDGPKPPKPVENK